jgi:hypothetical protein
MAGKEGSEMCKQQLLVADVKIPVGGGYGYAHLPMQPPPVVDPSIELRVFWRLYREDCFKRAITFSFPELPAQVITSNPKILFEFVNPFVHCHSQINHMYITYICFCQAAHLLGFTIGILQSVPESLLMLMARHNQQRFVQ